MKQLFESDSEKSEEEYEFNGEGDRGTLELKKSFKGDSRFKLTAAFQGEQTDVNQLSRKTKEALSEKELQKLQRQKQNQGPQEDEFEAERKRLLNILATVVPQAQVFGGSLVPKKKKTQDKPNGKPKKFEGLIQERFDPSKIVETKEAKPKKERIKQKEKKVQKEKTKKIPLFEKYVKVSKDWKFTQEDTPQENSSFGDIFSNTQSLLAQPPQPQLIEQEEEKKQARVRKNDQQKDEEYRAKKKLKREEKKKRKQKEKKQQNQGGTDFENRMLGLIAKFKRKNK